MIAVPEIHIFSQVTLYDQLMVWIREECLENPEWFGEDKYAVILHGDISIFHEVDKACRAHGISFFYGRLPVNDNKWMIGVVRSK